MLETRQLILRDLADRGSITEAEIAQAHRHSATHQTTLLHALVDIGSLAHRDLALARARVSEHPFVDLHAFEIDRENAGLLPRSLAERAGAFPIFVVDGVATVAMLDPLDLQSLELIRQATHHEIEPVVCEEPVLRELIKNAYAAQHVKTTDSSAPDQATPATTTPSEARSGRRPIDKPDHERELVEAASRSEGLTLITSIARHASTARLRAFSPDPIAHKGQAATLKRLTDSLNESAGPFYIDGLDDDLTARAAADAALGGTHVIATMTAADAFDAIDRLRVAGVTQRTLDAIEIAVFHIATTPDGIHEIVDVAGHPIYQRTPKGNATESQAKATPTRRLSA
mgnify:CR=1 FL=1